ncbi:MAG TPA: SpoIIE family protein phosphatase [Solirubrobacteraceae bacterium]|nr:SpoIIE family protein phosphatase [Solirubrobacteraceae bacterium]
MSERERDRLIAELRRALHGSERRFDAIVGSLGDPVTIRDREHHFVYANPAAVAHLGFETWEQLRDTSPSSIMSDYLVWSEDGREISMEDIPSVRILRGERAEPLLIRTVNRITGVQRWNLLKAAPLLDDEGEIEATITIIEEVTQQKRSERGSAFLARASAELSSTLDYEQTLRNVADLAVPHIADWCAVDLLDEDGDRRTVAVAHVDPERLRLAEALREYVPDELDPEQGLGKALLSGEAVLYPEINDEMLVQSALDDRHLELLRSVGFRSALIVPMLIGDRVLGAMTLVSAESVVVFDDIDLALAEQTASRAAVAIENSRLYSERSAIARTLQWDLLPEQLPDIPGYELASIYMPALQTSMVGGDFYDVWAVGGSWMVLVGDVTGKGIEAASLTALVRHTVRTASEFESSPAHLLAFVDRTLKKRATLSVCTAMCLRLDHDEATFAVGGHPLPLCVTADRVRELGEHGPLLGAFADVRWQDFTVKLKPGATLVAYTDGVTDARDDSGERFGAQRLERTLAELVSRPATEVVERLTATLEAFQVGAHADDTAALVLRRLPASELTRDNLPGQDVERTQSITTQA